MIKRAWYPLDNAANIYPVIQTREWTPMFRITAVLRDTVDPALLQQALTQIAPRFPGFCVRLRRGMFWYYLEEVVKPLRVEEDSCNPCLPMQEGEPLFRIRYWRNRIAGEFAHVICDGGGAMSLFRTLLAQYIRLLGVDVPNVGDILDIHQAPRAEEWEDGFGRFSRMGARPSRGEPLAYRPDGTRLTPGMRILTTGIVPLGDALKLAKSHRVSLTEYMAAVLLYVLYLQQEAQPGKRRPVKISIPVNLRKYYKTKTLRNFSQYLNPGIDPNYGSFSFEEVLNQVHHYFRYMFTEKNFNARISKNVADERNLAMRVVPLFLKKLVIRTVYQFAGECVYSSVISNVGPVALPIEMEPYFERFDLALATARRNVVECAMLSYGDRLSITFSRSIREAHTERMFFRMLVRQGLHVCVETNLPEA